MRKGLVVSTIAMLAVIGGCDRSGSASRTQPEAEADAGMTAEQLAEQKAAFDTEASAVLAALKDSEAASEAGAILLSEYDGPYQGVPHFDEMDLAGLKHALETGMERQLAEMDAIANNPAPPTFGNTIVAMEKSGDALNRVFTYWGIWSSNMSSPEFRQIQQEMAPRISEFFTKITQNEALFARVKAVYESPAKEDLTPEQQRLVWLVYDQFATNGATLEGEAKARYAEINKRLAELHTQFANN
ncbi:MAG: hypothetical protein ACX939_07405, partial [Hyphococcus sp.]